MAAYKKHCIYCENLIQGDSSICPFCAHESPFALRCVRCRKEVEKGYKLCPSCGFPLVIICPFCGGEVFPSMYCTLCGKQLLTACKNKKCGELQIISNKKCVKCGHGLK